jgi:hypothetical protein
MRDEDRAGACVPFATRRGPGPDLESRTIIAVGIEIVRSRSVAAQGQVAASTALGGQIFDALHMRFDVIECKGRMMTNYGRRMMAQP